MKTIRIERTVAAPASRVWRVLTDLPGTVRVLSAVDRIERLDDGADFGVGTRWRETRTIMRREATEEMTVTAVDPGRSYVVEADSRGAHYRSELGVAPQGDGSRLWMTFGAEPIGIIGRIMAATLGRLFEGTTRRMLERDLDEMAAAAESSEPQNASEM